MKTLNKIIPKNPISLQKIQDTNWKALTRDVRNVFHVKKNPKVFLSAGMKWLVQP